MINFFKKKSRVDCFIEEAERLANKCDHLEDESVDTIWEENSEKKVKDLSSPELLRLAVYSFFRTIERNKQKEQPMKNIECAEEMCKLIEDTNEDRQELIKFFTIFKALSNDFIKEYEGLIELEMQIIDLYKLQKKEMANDKS